MKEVESSYQSIVANFSYSGSQQVNSSDTEGVQSQIHQEWAETSYNLQCALLQLTLWAGVTR